MGSESLVPLGSVPRARGNAQRPFQDRGRGGNLRVKNPWDTPAPHSGTASRRSSALPPGPPFRIALSPSEAAEAIGVSRDFFDEHIRPELRVVRRGRRILVPVKELERWLDRSASRVLDEVDGRRLR